MDLEKELKELNPYEASEEMLRVYIQNPKLYKKINLKKQEDIAVLDKLLKLRIGTFHIL